MTAHALWRSSYPSSMHKHCSLTRCVFLRADTNAPTVKPTGLNTLTCAVAAPRLAALKINKYKKGCANPFVSIQLEGGGAHGWVNKLWDGTNCMCCVNATAVRFRSVVSSPVAIGLLSLNQLAAPATSHMQNHPPAT